MCYPMLTLCGVGESEEIRDSSNGVTQWKKCYVTLSCATTSSQVLLQQNLLSCFLPTDYPSR